MHQITLSITKPNLTDPKRHIAMIQKYTQLVIAIDKLVANNYRSWVTLEHSYGDRSTLCDLSIITMVIPREPAYASLANQVADLLAEAKDHYFRALPHINCPNDFSVLCSDLTAIGAAVVGGDQLFSTYSLPPFEVAKITDNVSSLALSAENNSRLSISSNDKGAYKLKVPRKLNLDDLLGPVSVDANVYMGVFKFKLIDFEKDTKFICRLDGLMVDCVMICKKWLAGYISGSTALHVDDALRAKYTCVKGHSSADDLYFIHEVLDHRAHSAMIQDLLDFDPVS